MKSWQPVSPSLAKIPYVEGILISEFVFSEIRISATKNYTPEVILISEFMNPETRITSTSRIVLRSSNFKLPIEDAAILPIHEH